jgi:hypothetical protein
MSLSGPEDLPGVDDLLGSFRWYDAFCINQEDAVERGHQVRQMDQIYRKCSMVCVWLGAAADDSDLAMDLVDSITLSCISAIQNAAHEKFTFEGVFVTAAQHFYEDENFTKHFTALLRLICRPWFSRLWIVQEVVLASTRTVFCGHRSVMWGMFFNAYLFSSYTEAQKANSMALLEIDWR